MRRLRWQLKWRFRRSDGRAKRVFTRWTGRRWMTKRRRQALEEFKQSFRDPDGYDWEALRALQDDAYGKKLPDV